MSGCGHHDSLSAPLQKVFRFSLQLILCMDDNLIFRMDKKFKYIIIYYIYNNILISFTPPFHLFILN